MIDQLVEVRLAHDEDFLKVRETLTRIGIASKTTNVLWQSCHILFKQKRFFIVHFKEMFALDGKPTNFTEDDQGRRNTIANLLEQWNLVTVVDPAKIAAPRVPPSQIKIISFDEKSKWTLKAKYTIGKKRS